MVNYWRLQWLNLHMQFIFKNRNNLSKNKGYTSLMSIHTLSKAYPEWKLLQLHELGFWWHIISFLDIGQICQKLEVSTSICVCKAWMMLHILITQNMYHLSVLDEWTYGLSWTVHRFTFEAGKALSICVTFSGVGRQLQWILLILKQ